MKKWLVTPTEKDQIMETLTYSLGDKLGEEGWSLTSEIKIFGYIDIKEKNHFKL